MIWKILAGVGAALALAASASAQPLTAMAELKPDAPVSKAQALAVKAMNATRTIGPIGIKPYVADLEASLAAQDTIEVGQMTPDMAWVAYDGPEEGNAYIAWTKSPEGQAKAPKISLLFQDPYVLVSFELGTYYNEVHDYDRALKALDEGMRLLRLRHDLERSSYAATVMNERGVALIGLKRWPDVLANYDDALTIKSLSPDSRARMYRGRGGALTDLGRLDDAEEAYRTSLVYAPGNAVALGELKYIAALRAGAKPTETIIAVPGLMKPNT